MKHAFPIVAMLSALLVASASAQTAVESAVSSSMTRQQLPGIAASDSNYLVTWTEDDGVYAGRLSFDGTILDGRGTLLRGWKNEPSTPFAPPVPSASTVFDGSSYLAAVSATDDFNYQFPDTSIAIVRINPATGARTASTAICGNDIRLARNDSATVAVWIDCSGSVDVAFLDANGAPARGYITLATYDPQHYGPISAKPTLAWNGSEWLVAWEEQYGFALASPYAHIELVTSVVRGLRLSEALTPIDRQPIVIVGDAFRIINGSSRIASDGNDFLIAWTEYATYSIHVRRISATSVPLGELTLAGGAVQDLVWDGAAYSLAYSTPKTSPDLALKRLRPDGQPFESLLISATPDDERSAALVALVGGRVLAAYTHVAHAPPNAGVERVFVAAPRPARSHASR